MWLSDADPNLQPASLNIIRCSRPCQIGGWEGWIYRVYGDRLRKDYRALFGAMNESHWSEQSALQVQRLSVKSPGGGFSTV